MRTPEGKVKDDVKKYLTSIGAYWFMPVQTGYGSSSLDFIVCFRGDFWAIECKAPGQRGKITKRQMRIAKNIQQAGGQTFVLDNVEQLKEEMWFRYVA